MNITVPPELKQVDINKARRAEKFRYKYDALVAQLITAAAELDSVPAVRIASPLPFQMLQLLESARLAGINFYTGNGNWDLVEKLQRIELNRSVGCVVVTKAGT